MRIYGGVYESESLVCGGEDEVVRRAKETRALDTSRLRLPFHFGIDHARSKSSARNHVFFQET